MIPRTLALQVAESLASELLGKWDGKKCIQYLREHDYHWKQMEWIGWYFEHRSIEVLKKTMRVAPGPKIGNVTIDATIENEPWDFKAHSAKRNDGWTYLNDVKAVEACVTHHRGIGWIIAIGEPTYDDTGDFKKWHDEMKGRKSDYEKKRIARGAKSRPRKKSFKCTHFLVAQAFTLEQITGAINEGILNAGMQKGQRNSNGKSRRSKFGIHISRATNAPSDSLLTIFTYP